VHIARAGLRLHAGGVQNTLDGRRKPPRTAAAPAASPVAGSCSELGAAYYLAREPATDAYDCALIDAGIALADRIHVRDGTLAVDRASPPTRSCAPTRFDTIYYMVRIPPASRSPATRNPAAAGRAAPADGSVYDATYRDTRVRAAALLAPCGGLICNHHGRRDDALSADRLVARSCLQRHAPGACSRC